MVDIKLFEDCKTPRCVFIVQATLYARYASSPKPFVKRITPTITKQH